jgi:crossover junction endodeoxyribonuclease RusA
MMQVTLPWPPAALKPNARGHWAIKARAAKAHKAACQILCMSQGIRALPWPAMSVTLEFRPPSARRADLDNMLAAMKAGLDGLSAASGVDDSLWHLTLKRGAPVKDGAVLVTLERAEAVPLIGWVS